MLLHSLLLSHSCTMLAKSSIQATQNQNNRQVPFALPCLHSTPTLPLWNDREARWSDSRPRNQLVHFIPLHRADTSIKEEPFYKSQPVCRIESFPLP